LAPAFLRCMRILSHALFYVGNDPAVALCSWQALQSIIDPPGAIGARADPNRMAAGAVGEVGLVRNMHGFRSPAALSRHRLAPP
jgi:hypothetical protein